VLSLRDLDSLYKKLCGYEQMIITYMENTVETKVALGDSVEEKYKVIATLKRFCRDAKEGKRDLALQELQNLESEIKAGNRELQNIWSKYRTETFTASKNLIAALVSVMKDETEIDKLSLLKMSIEQKIIGNRQTVKDIKEFRELTEKLIESRKMEPEVQEFIKKLASGEDILLYQISDKVYAWMKTNKLDRKVHLSIRA
jgi:hypothetical protein